MICMISRKGLRILGKLSSMGLEMKHAHGSKLITPNPDPGYLPAHPPARKPPGYGKRKSYMKPVRVGQDPRAHGKIKP